MVSFDEVHPFYGDMKVQGDKFDDSFIGQVTLGSFFDGDGKQVVGHDTHRFFLCTCRRPDFYKHVLCDRGERLIDLRKKLLLCAIVV